MEDRLRAALASVDDADLSEPLAPPIEVWEGIAAALDADQLGASGPAAAPPVDGASPLLDAGVQEAPVSRLHPRPPRRRVVVLLAVAAAVFVVLISGAVVVRTRQAGVAEVAVLTDDNLPTRTNVRGRAELIEKAGTKELEVDVPDLPAPTNGQVFEVWLMSPDGAGLQSLGLIDGSGTLTVPATLDTSKFNVVDVSREPVDGNPTHSGDSIVRGTLVPA